MNEPTDEVVDEFNDEDDDGFVGPVWGDWRTFGEDTEHTRIAQGRVFNAYTKAIRSNGFERVQKHERADEIVAGTYKVPEFLTPRDHRVIAFWKTTIDKTGKPPSNDEIADLLCITSKSRTNQASAIVGRLVRIDALEHRFKKSEDVVAVQSGGPVPPKKEIEAMPKRDPNELAKQHDEIVQLVQTMTQKLGRAPTLREVALNGGGRGSTEKAKEAQCAKVAEMIRGKRIHWARRSGVRVLGLPGANVSVRLGPSEPISAGDRVLTSMDLGEDPIVLAMKQRRDAILNEASVKAKAIDEAIRTLAGAP